MDHEKIGILKIKLNPFIQGKGVRLFGNSTRKYSLEHIETAQYEQRLQIITYRINYTTPDHINLLEQLMEYSLLTHNLTKLVEAVQLIDVREVNHIGGSIKNRNKPY